ncbi:MAG: hypothetical protein IM445_21610 [Microcystis sp. M015S1]|jgi:hypothetical protein|nr:hypothetical protein [Microcystis sp. M015S1]MCA3160230.1 hypothetical protein [Burkholderiales bacterium]MCA3162671.1 hypothetical protein [Burkholderiales bacterium]MCA3170830.1 hypothetical protein [Burkholderiales bacterium]MCA3173418.1 hypothetical protein [Burkholderiales bacterium]
MKAQIALCAVVLIGCCMLSATAQAEQTAAANEVRQVKFAERVITIELVRALSLSVRKTREKCLMACPETEALELAVGLIGISRSDVASDALVNLLGVRLDGAGSEELNCQILIRGAALSRRLERLRTGQVVNRCQSTFLELRKRELADVSDVKVEQVCRSEAEIRSVRDELLKAVKSKVMCEQ